MLEIFVPCFCNNSCTLIGLGQCMYLGLLPSLRDLGKSTQELHHVEQFLFNFRTVLRACSIAALRFAS